MDAIPDDMTPWGTWWEPYVYGYNYYMFVDPEMSTREETYRKKEMDFWNGLPLFENKDQNVIRDEL